MPRVRVRSGATGPRTWSRRRPPTEAEAEAEGSSAQDAGLAARHDDDARGARGADDGRAATSPAQAGDVAGGEKPAMGPREAKLRAELQDQAKAQDRGVIDTRDHADQALDRLQDSQAALESAVARREVELASDQPARVARVAAEDERVARAHQQLVEAQGDVVGLRTALESATAERDRAQSETAAASDPAAELARRHELAAAHERVQAAQAEHAAGNKALEDAAGAFDRVVQTALEERAAALDDAVHDAYAHVGQAGVELETAVAAHDAALDAAVEELYQALRAERQKVFDAADAQTKRVCTQAAERLKEAGQQAEQAQAAVEKSGEDFDARKAEFEARKKGHLEESIRGSQAECGHGARGVETQ